ncbi:hypothetical protein [Klebsiella pneumoniae]|uniref:hypothetical protein n=1 Tax=Klebsiella pneumoniae TaxID=573 RepID=UPI00132FB778|nr:hypothetical protein [Klebsiella pneumoniae]
MSKRIADFHGLRVVCVGISHAALIHQDDKPIRSKCVFAVAFTALLTEMVTQHREEIRMAISVDIVRLISFVKQPVTCFCAFLACLEVAGIAILDDKNFLVGIAWIDSAVTLTAAM